MKETPCVNSGVFFNNKAIGSLQKKRGRIIYIHLMKKEAVNLKKNKQDYMERVWREGGDDVIII